MFLFECFDLHCSLQMNHRYRWTSFRRWDAQAKNAVKGMIGPSQKRTDSFQVHCHPWWKVQMLDFFCCVRAAKKGHMLAKEHCKYKVMLACVATSSLIAWKLCTFAYQILGSQKLKQVYIPEQSKQCEVCQRLKRNDRSLQTTITPQFYTGHM